MGYDNLKLEKGMYRQTGMCFTQVLESLDPSENYRGTALEGTDAFQRQLKRFGIRVKGPGSSTVEKFFHTLDSAVLFPEYISRSVRQGMEENNILPNMVATVTDIDSMDYRSIYSVPSNDQKTLTYLAEGSQLPATTVQTREQLVRLPKPGRMPVANYEALRFQKLDLFSVMLRQIGAYIQKMHVKDAIDVLTDGDSNDDFFCYFVEDEPFNGTTGTLTYKDLLVLWSKFDPFSMNTMICDDATLYKILEIPELQNPLTGLNFQGTGKLSTPLGAQLFRTGNLPYAGILALDNRYALEMIRAGDVMVEYDKLIDRQLERAAITTICGFGKIYDEATRFLRV